MTEDTRLEEARSIDTVIRGFTDAELALREISGAVERIRSASEQLDQSRADQAAARQALSDTVSAVDQLSEQIARVVDGLRETAGVLATLQPERLWRHLEDHSARLQRASDKSSADTSDAASRTENRIDSLDRVARRTRLIILLAVVVGLANLGLLLVIASRVLSLS